MRKFLGNLVLIALFSALPCASFSQVAVGFSVSVAPPELPIYEQPICPGPNYMWTPGYWAWDPGSGGYYWVPGTWVLAPAVGLLWTPGYWGWGDGAYLWHAGYWGPEVGFYGGVNYGYGYNGAGFYGGRWNRGYFSYNTAVMHVDTTIIHNTYIDRTVIHETTINHVSYNGGRGGLNARPTAAQEAAAHQKRFDARPEQLQQERIARQDKSNFASENHGRPAYAATTKPVSSVAELHRAVPANGARPVTANETRPSNGRPATTNRPANETRPATHPETPVPNRSTAESRPATRPTPQARPEARPETKATTTARPATPAQPAARPESRPAPAQQAVRPTPQARPEPQPQRAARHSL